MKYLLLATLLFLPACDIPHQHDPTASPAPSSAPTGDKLTAANFAKLQTGMTLAEVQSILGPGSLQSEMDAGQFGKHQNYVWQSGLKFINVTLTDGKLASKSQAGL